MKKRQPSHTTHSTTPDTTTTEADPRIDAVADLASTILCSTMTLDEIRRLHEQTKHTVSTIALRRTLPIG
jgi:uncharacterized protein (DUF4213/DUF364 family)